MPKNCCIKIVKGDFSGNRFELCKNAMVCQFVQEEAAETAGDALLVAPNRKLDES